VAVEISSSISPVPRVAFDANEFICFLSRKLSKTIDCPFAQYTSFIATSIDLSLNFLFFNGMFHPLNYRSPVFRRWQLTYVKNWRQENVEGQNLFIGRLQVL
jgi:hypothetical protein